MTRNFFWPLDQTNIFREIDMYVTSDFKIELIDKSINNYSMIYATSDQNRIFEKNKSFIKARQKSVIHI